MPTYGLPFHDVSGITSYDDLKDPELARRMGQVMHERMGRGDVVANLAATSLITNAYLFSGEEKYRQWVVQYVDAWIERDTDINDPAFATEMATTLVGLMKQAGVLK